MIHVYRRPYRIAPYLLPLLLIFCGCRRGAETRATVYPTHFLTTIPFQTDNRGLLIATHWGSNGKEYKLYLDNHSPSWVNDAVLRNNPSVSKSKDFAYSTTTADGKVLKGDVYICDSVHVGPVCFANIPFYNISPEKGSDKTDGVVGESIMEHGVWKIDFRNSRLTIASAIDSITGMSSVTKLPALFTDKAIEIEIIFSNNDKQHIGLDLGYNGDIILPSAAFIQAIAPYKKTFTEKRRFSTPAGSGIVDDRNTHDRVKAGGQSLEIRISSNKLEKEKLIGLGFFRQFDFLIIDYINKAVYLSQKRVQ